MEKIKLGSTVKDVITGFTGIVMARTEYLTKCAHLGILVTKMPKDGKIPNWEWIDETRCTVVKKEKIKLQEPAIPESNGGNMQNAPER